MDQEWADHNNTLSMLTRNNGTTPERSLAPTTLKSGGRLSVSQSRQPESSASSTASSSPDIQYPECKGDNVDLMVRLGLLKLVSEISGVTRESLPETMKLNFLRLRAVQACIQKITVIATSVLVFRLTLLSESIVIYHVDMERIAKQLSDLLNTVEDAGISNISELQSQGVNSVDNFMDKSKHESLKNIMARMLSKRLQANDAIFNRISLAVYLISC